jgi:hypothetical protein
MGEMLAMRPSDPERHGLGMGGGVRLRWAGRTPVVDRPVETTARGIAQNPSTLWGRTSTETEKAFNDAGYKTTTAAGTRGSGNLTMIHVHGHPDIQYIKVHPGGGTQHRGPYIEIGTKGRDFQGKLKIIDPLTYRHTGEGAKFVPFYSSTTPPPNPHKSNAR